MEAVLRHRGRDVTASDAAFIRELIAQHPEASRRQLSAVLCEAWDWRQPNGHLRDMVARGLMLELDRAGLIELPARKCSPPNNVVRHARPPRSPLVVYDPIEAPLSSLAPLRFELVRRTGAEALVDSLIETYHYLGYTRPVGEHLKYLVRTADGVPVACLAFSSAPRHLGCRDRFIGWDTETRRANVRLLAYNTRYLILPWVRVPHLASHILGRLSRRIGDDWLERYGHRVWLLETFVDPGRFRGTCYRAANWQRLGLTTGRGHNDQTMKPNRPLKELWVYPLAADFRRRLGVTSR